MLQFLNQQGIRTYALAADHERFAGIFLNGAYAYNEKVAGRKDVNPNTVVIFESDLGWNGSGGMTNVVAKPRHRGNIFVGFAGGGIRQVRTNDLRQLRWEP
jgi:hypothetical protein